MDPANRISEAERLAVLLEDEGEVPTRKWVGMRLRKRLRQTLSWLWRNTWGRI